jgi:hypothetical protein
MVLRYLWKFSIHLQSYGISYKNLQLGSKVIGGGGEVSNRCEINENVTRNGRTKIDLVREAVRYNDKEKIKRN